MSVGIAQSGGLPEFTEDISKLVNLKVLQVKRFVEPFGDIPDQISCLQKLTYLHIDAWPLSNELPTGFAMLAKLVHLYLTCCEDLRLPPNLQVSCCDLSRALMLLFG